MELAYWREYRQRPEVKERERLRSARRARDPAYRKARNARNRVNPAKPAWDKIRKRVARGTLKRQPCVFCGRPNGNAHHEDYSKPLEIVWVCQPHHMHIHAGKLKVLPEHIVMIPERYRRLS